MYAKAGIIDGFTTKPVSIEENIKKLAKMPLHHNPGEKFTYSEGLDVLGYFIEIMSGMPFDEFLRTRIFDPLGMNDTWFYLPKSKKKRLVNVYELVDDKWSELKPGASFDPDYPISGAKQFFSGGAGLSSTAIDYATFLQMYLNNGEYNGVRLLSRTTVKTILANQIGDIWAGSGSYYGLAFSVKDQLGEDQGGAGSKGTFEWGGYFNTQISPTQRKKLLVF
jgi:CubicO group peptidase (beta-lactamase class C family)